MSLNLVFKGLDRALQDNWELKRQLNNVSEGALKDANEEALCEMHWREALQVRYSKLLQDYRILLGVSQMQKAELSKVKVTSLQHAVGVAKSGSTVRLKRKC